MTTLISVPGIQRTSLWFRWELVNIGRRLNVDPDFLANVMSVESGFKPEATNPYTSATGLIQFMPTTAERLGTTVGALRGMSAEDQLFYVERFYKPFTGRLRTPGDAYMATFMPAYVGDPPETILFSQGSKGYEQNKGLDKNKDGYITVGDVTGAAQRNYERAANMTRTEVPEEEPPRPKAQGAQENG